MSKQLTTVRQLDKVEKVTEHSMTIEDYCRNDVVETEKVRKYILRKKPKTAAVAKGESDDTRQED